MGQDELVLKVPPDRPLTHSREPSSASSNQAKIATSSTSSSPSKTMTSSLRSAESCEEDRFTPDCDIIEDGISTTSETADTTSQTMPGDSKSQNSDYGSFCNTPCDAFAAGSGDERVGIPAASGPPGGEDQIDKAEDQSVMANESYQRQPLLRDSADSSEEDEATNRFGRRRAKHKPVRIDIDSSMDSDLSEDPDIPGEPLKTLAAFVFLFLAWVATTTSLALTHERVPETDPVPDIFLDNVQYQHWGLDASEILIMVSTWTAFLVSIFHKHRFVVLRRIFLIVGIHYYYRAVTMFVTVLPKADPHYKCAPKLNDTTPLEIAQRVLKLLSGMGLSINGKHVYCGDYIYSGHTMTLIMAYFVIKEYSPQRWFLLHWLSLATTITGILTLLLARGHYSIDVVIAYYITTRVWWIYHTLLNNPTLRESGPHNYLSRSWWWYIFCFFERNVPAFLPRQFGWPWPKKWQRWPPWKRNSTSAATEDNQE